MVSPADGLDLVAQLLQGLNFRLVRLEFLVETQGDLGLIRVDGLPDLVLEGSASGFALVGLLLDRGQVFAGRGRGDLPLLDEQRQGEEHRPQGRHDRRGRAKVSGFQAVDNAAEDGMMEGLGGTFSDIGHLAQDR